MIIRPLTPKLNRNFLDKLTKKDRQLVLKLEKDIRQTYYRTLFWEIIHNIKETIVFFVVLPVLPIIYIIQVIRGELD